MKELYADVIVDIAGGRLDKTFQYRVPEELIGLVREGSKVRVPFGGGERKIDGYVLAFSETPKIDKNRIKEIEDCPQTAVTPREKLIYLAGWIRQTYGGSFIQALKTVLPVKEKKKVKEERLVETALSAEETQALQEEYARKHHTARARLLSALLEEPIPWEKATKELKLSAAVLRELEKQGIIAIRANAAYRDTLSESVRSARAPLPVLSEEQQDVYENIWAQLQGEEARPCLLRGITGSGKTSVYMHLIARILEQGKQAILLIPEISLTWQTVSRFYRCFGEKTAVLHSRLSDGERSDLLERVQKGEVSLVIGPRSALFTPFERLGLIIVDEEHDSSYQSGKSPRYHARETAVQRAKLEGAGIVFGSATPSLEARYRCEIGEYALFTLESRFANAQLPQIRIVDMREELAKGRTSIFSEELANEMAQRLEDGEQCILFLNRRGYTGFFTCRSCGNVVKCPHCDVSLTYHRNGLLICHYCGFSHPMVKTCPSCGSPYIGSFRVGTQKVEESLKKIFPKARVLRMDKDTTSGKDGYERILKQFAEGGADILVGTQMIVKGHDFPKVTLVGALAADTSLNVSDYRAAEETFQLLVQAAGRAGRGEQPGCAIIQTYHPEHYAIQAVQTQDYEAFYEEEVLNRRLMGYPPVGCMQEIHGSGADAEKLMNAMAHLRSYLESIRPDERTILLGPVQETVAKIKDMYYVVLYIRHNAKEELIRMRQYTERYIAMNSGFDKITIQFVLDV